MSIRSISILLIILFSSILAIPSVTYSDTNFSENQVSLLYVVNQTVCDVIGADAYFDNLTQALDYLNNTIGYFGYDDAVILICPGTYNENFSTYYMLHDLVITALDPEQKPILNITYLYGLGFMLSSNIEISNIIINGSLTGLMQIEFTDSSNIVLSNIDLKNATTGILISDSNNVMINNINIHQTHDLGIKLVNVEGATILGGDLYGSGFTLGIPEVRDTAHRFSQGSTVFQVESSTTYGIYAFNVTNLLLNNLVIMNFDYAVYIVSSNQVHLYNDTFYVNLYGLYEEATNNTYINDLNSSINFFGYSGFGLDTLYINNSVFINNYVMGYIEYSKNIGIFNVWLNYNYYGLSMYNVSNVVIDTASIVDTYYIGLEIYGDMYGYTRNVYVSNLVIANSILTPQNGIYLSSEYYVYNVTFDNVIVQNTETGVYVDALNITIINSVIRYSYTGLYVTDSHYVDIINSIIENNTIGMHIYYVGVYPASTCCSVNVLDSIIRYNSLVGVFMELSYNVPPSVPQFLFDNVSFDSNGGSIYPGAPTFPGGLSIEGGISSATYPTAQLVVIRDSSFTNNNATGIHLYNTENIRIINCYISSPIGYGVITKAADYVYIQDSTVINNYLIDIGTIGSYIIINNTLFSYEYNFRLDAILFNNTKIHPLPHDELISLYEHVPGGARALMVAFNITLMGDSWAYIVFHYTDDLLEEKGIGEDYVGYYYYAAVDNTWKYAPGTWQDKDANILALNITGGTIYSILGFPPLGVGGSLIPMDMGGAVDQLLLLLVSIIAVVMLLQLVIRIKKK